MNRLRILFLAICGELLKLYYRMGLGRVPYGLNREEKRKERIVVSLTSYGRRVKSVLPYAIISLLRQTCKPDLIVLWLDEEHWNDRNLPKSLKKLREKGLTVRYCEDLKSYKKLIPTLKAYPDDIIITVDDDVFYRKDLLKRLILAYKKDSSRIYAHRAHQILFGKDGTLLPYSDWKLKVSGVGGRSIFPTGVGGCLYKRSLLYKDVCRDDLFMSLAPRADDVWFYFMEVLQGTECVALPDSGNIFIPLDTFYQYFQRDASLSALNCKESQNDVQIVQVMNHYSLRTENLR